MRQILVPMSRKKRSSFLEMTLASFEKSFDTWKRVSWEERMVHVKNGLIRMLWLATMGVTYTHERERLRHQSVGQSRFTTHQPRHHESQPRVTTHQPRQNDSQSRATTQQQPRQWTTNGHATLYNSLRNTRINSQRRNNQNQYGFLQTHLSTRSSSRRRMRHSRTHYNRCRRMCTYCRKHVERRTGNRCVRHCVRRRGRALQVCTYIWNARTTSQRLPWEQT